MRAAWIPALFLVLTISPAGAQSPSCREYCDNVMGPLGACVGPFQIYESMETCYQACAQFPDDAPDDAVSGDSVQCRNEHAKLAQGEEGPYKHCPHAAPLGGGVCVDRSPCEAYCLFYYDRTSPRARENDCPTVRALEDSALLPDGEPVGAGKEEQGTGRFTPSKTCLEVCSGFAESGEEFEMSGDSANCRMQYYLMAHRIDPLHTEKLTPAQRERKTSLCDNAHPFTSTMCTGSQMNMFYNVREVYPCKELCYTDWLACDSSYGTPETCLQTCAAFPEVGERGATSGDSVYCRLTWAQNAFFVQWDDPEMARVLCRFAQPKSLVCTSRNSTAAMQGH